MSLISIYSHLDTKRPQEKKPQIQNLAQKTTKPIPPFRKVDKDEIHH